MPPQEIWKHFDPLKAEKNMFSIDVARTWAAGPPYRAPYKGAGPATRASSFLLSAPVISSNGLISS